MCHFETEGQEEVEKYENAISLFEIFGQQIYNHHRLPLAEPGRCPVNGRYLSHIELYPDGKMPRFMSQEAYLGIINRPDKTACAGCGTRLSDEQVNNQYSSNRELYNHYCQPCFDFQKILAAIVFGIPKALQLNEELCMIAYNMQNNSNLFSFGDDERDLLPVHKRRPLRLDNKQRRLLGW